MGLADVTQVPVPNGQPATQFWAGVRNSTDNILVTNSDLTNTVFVGTRPEISASGLNVIPVLPNASLTLAADRNWFVIGSATGISNLLVIPGGIATFLGITAGLGKLVIPAIQSPNFVHGVSGWSIQKNGNVEFNNGIFRGTITASTITGSTIIGGLIETASTNPSVQLDGSRDALFVYDASNNLLFSAAGLAGTDFFGHAYPLGALIGPSGILQSGTLAPGVKVDGNGNIIVFNSHGAIITYISASKDGTFVYADTGSATQGALIASNSGTTGTDPVNGTKYISGVTAYLTIGGVTYNASLNQTTSIVGGVGLSINDDNSPAFAAGGVFGEVSGGTTKQAIVTLASGQATNVDAFSAVQTFSQVQSSVSGGLIKNNAGLTQIGGGFELDGPAIAKAQMQSLNAVQIFPDATSVTPARYSDGGNGDGNTYAIGQLTNSLHGTQLISSTTPVVITNMSFNVAVGVRYRLDMMLTWTGVGATGNAVFGFDGSSVTTQQSTFFWTAGPTSGTSTGGNITSPTLTTTRQGLMYTALLVCTTAGVFNVRAQITSGGSNFNINDSYVTLTPL